MGAPRAARHCLGGAKHGLEVAHRPSPAPSGSRSAWQVWGTDHAGQPGRRGSRDSGQTANMLLVVVQIETRPPEQLIRPALQRADHRPNAAAFNQPAT